MPHVLLKDGPFAGEIAEVDNTDRKVVRRFELPPEPEDFDGELQIQSRFRQVIYVFSGRTSLGTILYREHK